jgi:hypothetical protein
LKELQIATQNLSAGASAAKPLATPGQPSTSPRREQLRATLLSTVDLLQRRRADLIDEGAISDYVAMHWLEWNGGALRLTVTGKNICDQLKAETRESQGPWIDP